MKEEILKQFTTRLIHYADSAEIFLKGNVPDYIEQLLKYEMITNIRELILGFTLLILALILTYTLYKKVDHSSCKRAPIIGSFSVFMVMWVLWFFTSGMHNINTITKINVAPKVYVIDYLRNKR